MQGAGGVGGLLAVVEHDSAGNETYYVTYDANGNISGYVDDTGPVVAHYEYCPFGQLTVAIGPKADDFAHRFSTKYLDSETELYYYGFRYYSSELGRWISRDPIGEQGGLNLYGFVGNDGINAVDPMGLWLWKGELTPTERATTERILTDMEEAGVPPAWTTGLKNKLERGEIRSLSMSWIPIEGMAPIVGRSVYVNTRLLEDATRNPEMASVNAKLAAILAHEYMH